ALPYFQKLRDDMGPGFTPEVRRMATFNVIDELIKRQLLVVEAERLNLEVTQADIDALLMKDPFFITNGAFDQAKFNAYKTNAGSNYRQVLPMMRETAAVLKLDQTLRTRFAPSAAELRSEWTRRSDQVRMKMLPLFNRDMSPEPEATEAEWAAYYQAHPDQFMRKTRVHLRYARLTIPPEDDSNRPSEEAQAITKAQAIADSLRRGTLPDTSATLVDTGPFEIPATQVPGLGRVTGLTDTLARADEDSTLRVVGPYTTRDAVIVGVLTDRQRKYLPPMRDVLGDVKRRADADKRRLANEAERLAFFDAHRDRWRGTRVKLTRLTLDPSTLPIELPPPAEVERWYAQHGRTLFGLADSSRAWMPPLSDSLGTVIRERLIDGSRARRAAEAMDKLAQGLRTTRDLRGLARANGAVAETLSLVRGATVDTVFTPLFVDSLLASSTATRGTVQGPRTFARYSAVWRVDAADTSFVPAYETVKALADREFADDKRQKDEAEARTHYEQHRDQYKTPLKYALDVVAVPIPPADSVRVTDAELIRQYNANQKDYRQEEQVKARHILFMPRDPAPEVKKAARARADSLLAAIRKDGGDFADLARRFSQEPGAPSSGGDLGWFGRGRMVKEFETAAFALKPGEMSGVVETQFGYHIIKVEERKAAGVRPFAEARAEIRLKMAQTRGDSSARRSALALRRRLTLAKADVRALAARYGGLISPGPLTANEPLPGVGMAQGLGQALPSMTPGRWAPDVYRAGERYLVVRVRERVDPRPAEFDEVKAAAVQDMRNAKRRAVLDQKVTEIRAALAAGASLDSLAAPYGGLKDSGLIGQTGGFIPALGGEPRVLERAFAMKTGETTDTLHVSQGVVWVRLEERKAGDAAAFRAASAAIEAELVKKRYDAWMDEKKRTTRVEILRADLKGPRPTPFRT
ncbi:MAG TPA: peptidyl-prolyl cis-trans isomerase, partial [Candidatus Eisenbacteria bacterium]|nr:peptidyl-prolyl cis-trans isomerase [Candidatus Eisenbacteria bacterium]